MKHIEENAEFQNKETDNIISNYMNNSISPTELNFCLWVLTCVYGWELQKMRKMKLTTILRFMKYSKKKLTVENIQAIESFFTEPKESLWRGIKRKIARN